MIPEGKERRDLNPFQMMFAGAMAGMAYWAVPFPADVVKSRIQTMDPTQAALMADSKGNTGFGSVFQHILKTEGVKGLYRGLGVTLLRAGMFENAREIDSLFLTTLPTLLTLCHSPIITVPANATIFFVYELVSKSLS